MEFFLSMVVLIFSLLEILFTALVLGNSSLCYGACYSVKDMFKKSISLFNNKNILGITLSIIICFLGMPAFLILCIFALIEISMNICLYLWKLGNKKERV
jgi:hypothetical protein